MSSWATVLAKEAAQAAAPALQPSIKDKRIAVVDANAIINMGRTITSLGDTLFTTEDVLAEIRDSASRQVIEQVAFVCRQPSSNAVKAVTDFAKKTGDLHQLSVEDIRLLALVYSLEAELHGVAHLRQEPVQVRRHARRHAKGGLPGWGSTGQSDEWDAIDAVDDDEPHAEVLASVPEDDAGSSARLAEGRSIASGSGPTSAATHESDADEGGEDENGCSSDGDASDGGGKQEDDDAWEVARKSGNAMRRAKRKAHRRALRQEEQAARDAHYQPSIGAASQRSKEDGAHGQDAASAGSEYDTASDAASQSDSDDGGEGAAAGEAAGAAAQSHADETGSIATTATGFESNVSLVTADFAMQNVCLQMGMRLVTKDGRRIARVSRYVMRCQGCATVCKATSKLFCPACGHATLEKVEVTIGPDNAEQYGVRRKHVLKGTRYSLPKPRSGRNAANPILSQDVYDARIRKPRKKKTVAAEDEDPLEGIMNYGELKKNANMPAHLAQGLSHLTTSARNNPNERKATMRSNRRKR